MKAMYPLGDFTLFRIDLQGVIYVDTANQQNFSFWLDLASSFCHQLAFTSRNVTRFQRASKGARQSPSRRSDHIIQGRGLGIMNRGIHPVKFGYLRM